MRVCSVDGCGKAHIAKGYCGQHYNRVKRYGDPNTFQRVRISGSNEERFWGRVDKSKTCWVWTGTKYRNGYGSAWDSSRGKSVLAHRLAYEFATGLVPAGMQLDHTCHNRACVNPAHLRAVTNKQNNENPSGLRRDNSTGFRGVRLEKRTGRYVGRAYHHGQEHHAGTFDTAEEAAEAARQLRLSLFTHNDADRRPAT